MSCVRVIPEDPAQLGKPQSQKHESRIIIYIVASGVIPP